MYCTVKTYYDCTEADDIFTNAILKNVPMNYLGLGNTLNIIKRNKKYTLFTVMSNTVKNKILYTIIYMDNME